METGRNIASPISLYRDGRCDCCGRKVKKVVATVHVSLQTNQYIAHGSAPEGTYQVRPVGPECADKYRPDEVR